MEQIPTSIGASGDLLEKKRSEMLKIILPKIQQCEEIWKVLSKEQQSCCFLILKQTFLSARFNDFNEIWKQIDFDQKADLVHLFLIVNSEVTRVNEFLTEFENKAQKTSAILNDAIEVLNCKIKELNNAREVCLGATRLEQLETLVLPDFSQIKCIPYPDVGEMCVKWEEFNLDGKLDACFEALEMLNFR